MWIKSEASLGADPRLLRLVSLLGVNDTGAVGHLHYFWWWCVTYAPSGDLSGYDAREIALGAHWEGNHDLFVEAMCQAGFLRGDKTTGYAARDWSRQVGDLITRRRNDAERKRSARLMEASQSPDRLRAESTRSPAGVHEESTRSPAHRVLTDSLRTGTSLPLSTRTPQGVCPTEKSRVDQSREEIPPFIPPFANEASPETTPLKAAAAEKPEFLKTLSVAFPKFSALKPPGLKHLLDISAAAEEKGLDLVAEAERFVSWWKGRGSGPASVVLAWHNWLAKARENPFETAPYGDSRRRSTNNVPEPDWPALAAASEKRNRYLIRVEAALRAKYGEKHIASLLERRETIAELKARGEGPEP